MSHNVLQLVLDFQQTPSRFEALIDPSQPMPEGMDALLESVASWNQLPPDKLSDVIFADASRGELIKAAGFFVGRVLFTPGGDHYRTLGLAHNASLEQIRKHYYLLLSFFFLDRKDKATEWNAGYAELINRAYSILRDPEKRRAYDISVHNQGDSVSRSMANEDLEYPGLNGVVAGTGYTQPAVPFPSSNSHQKSSGNLNDQKEPPIIHDQVVQESGDKDDAITDSVGNLAAKNNIAPSESMLESDALITNSIERAYGALGDRKLSSDQGQVLQNSSDTIKATEDRGKEKHADSFLAEKIERAYGALGDRKLSSDQGQVLQNSSDTIKATEDRGKEKHADSFLAEKIAPQSERPIEPIYRKSPNTRSLPRVVLTVALVVVIGVAAAIYMFQTQPPDHLASRTGVVPESPAVGNKGEISAEKQPSMQLIEQMAMTEQNPAIPMKSSDGDSKLSPSKSPEAEPAASTARKPAPIELADKGRSKLTTQSDGRTDERAKPAALSEARSSKAGTVAGKLPDTRAPSRQGENRENIPPETRSTGALVKTPSSPAETPVVAKSNSISRTEDAATRSSVVQTGQTSVEKATEAAKGREQLAKRKEKAPVASVVPSGTVASQGQEARQTVAKKQIPLTPDSKVQQVAVPTAAKKLDISTPAPVVSTTLTSPNTGELASLRELVDNSISKEELNKLIAKFIRSYEEGDLGLLLSLFAEDARTNDQNNRKGIAEDYRTMFAGTEKRQFIFNGLRWVHGDDAKATGEGGFEVKILPKGGGSIDTYTGNVTIRVEKRKQTVLITHLYHEYQ